MSRPLILDLYCGAGGAAVGFWRAGFDVVGIDSEPQPNYPFRFIRARVSQVKIAWIRECGFVAVHASPPCQAQSVLQHRTGLVYPKLIAPTQKLLDASGLPFVIENVEGANELRDPIMLCGTMFPGLRVIRHRKFEANWPLAQPAHLLPHPLVFTHDKRKPHRGLLDQDVSFVSVTGGGNSTMVNAFDAMGINWMKTKVEVNESIPPAYTEYVGRELLKHLEER